MDNKKTYPLHLDDESRQHTRWGTILLSTILVLVYAYVLTQIFIGEKTTQSYIAMAVLLLVSTSTVMGLVLSIRQRTELGLKLTYYSLIALCVAAVVLFQGRTTSITFSILSISTVGFIWLFPQHTRREYATIMIVSLVAIWVTELLNPAWRLSMNMAQVGPAGAGIFVILFAIYIFRESQNVISSNLRLKITIWTGLILTGISIILIVYSQIIARQAAVDAAEKEALSFAESQARSVRADVEIPLDTARALAHALTSTKEPSNDEVLSRTQVNAMLRQVLLENPNFLGTYTLWEPNAFDGLDQTFKGTAAHDNTGRFIPYWVRGDDGSLTVTALLDYETPGLGDWYLIPRQTQKEVTIAPLIYPIQGVDTVMASFVVPIIYADKFYGIAGVDAPIAFVQNLVDQVDLYNGKAGAVLMTSDGTLISVRNQPELVNQPAAEIFPDFLELQSRIQAGESFISLSPDGDSLRAFAAVDLGQTGDHWSFVLLVPFSEIIAPANTAAIRQGVIGLVLISTALAILWFLSGQIVRPVRELTTVANAISQGNLNVTARVQAADETGLLASTINLMITQLRESFVTLEERVAERTQNLELASQVGRSVSQLRKLDVMLKDAAEIIRSRFDLYYVQVYLTNPSKTYLNLQAGTGHVGEELLARNHRLPINTGSINGRAAVEKRSVIIADTSTSTTFRPNPLLPNTRSEMAVPLILGETVVGVLDMQSETAGALNHEMLSAFEALAGQLAIAIQNANLLAEAEQARAEVEAQAQRLTRTNWASYLDAIHKPEESGYVFEQNKVMPMVEAEDQTVNDDALTAPIAITGETIGNLVVELEGQSPLTRPNELINIVARQVAQQIENLRLLENAERYRVEAEEASRRLIREGWKTYKEGAKNNLSYLYDLKEVRPLNGDSTSEPALSIPLKVRDELIGELAIQGMNLEDGDSASLAAAVADRLSSHIETLRQYDQAQSALEQSEKLFDASRRLTQATSLQDLVAATVESLDIPVVNRAVLGIFNYGADDKLESMSIEANWWNGTGHNVTAIGVRYPVAVFRTVSLFASPVPLFFADAFNDERADAATLQLAKQLNLRAVAVLPLYIGTRQVGVLMLEAEQPYHFSQDEIRLFSSLAPQIATVLENRRQFDRAQQQAERESTLNLISQKIQSATTVDAVLQIAARELGHALGAPMTIAQLSMKDKEK
ncbi:MAG TPA: GAF domain-containing protein [Anaerolineales bacterium]|nr:GAF domain-containing protein [Anaerolineales bacterium]